MKYAIISDVHANMAALNAVLTELPSDAEVLHIGDLVGYGAHPNEVVNALRLTDGVRGNHDDAALGLIDLNWFNETAAESARWTQKQLTEENLRVLQALPYVLGVDDVNTNMKFTLVHGSGYEPKEFRYVTNAKEAMLCMSSLMPRITFVGHSHLPMSFSRAHSSLPVKKFIQGDKVNAAADVVHLDDSSDYVFNVGSVGQPRDGQSTACYVIFDTTAKTVQYKRVKYSISAAVQDILNAGLPAFNALRLKSGN